MSATSALPSDTIYFTRISSTDHTGILGVITLLSLVYTVISSGARLWSRCGRYGADDWTLLACMLIGVCQHASIFVALHFGLGKASELLHRNQIEALSHVRITMLSTKFFCSHRSYRQYTHLQCYT